MVDRALRYRDPQRVGVVIWSLQHDVVDPVEHDDGKPAQSFVAVGQGMIASESLAEAFEKFRVTRPRGLGQRPDLLLTDTSGGRLASGANRPLPLADADSVRKKRQHMLILRLQSTGHRHYPTIPL